MGRVRRLKERERHVGRKGHSCCLRCMKKVLKEKGSEGKETRVREEAKLVSMDAS